MADLWSSARLIYRGVDDEDEPFLGRLSGDPIAFLNIAPHLPGESCPESDETDHSLSRQHQHHGARRMQRDLGSNFRAQTSSSRQSSAYHQLAKTPRPPWTTPMSSRKTRTSPSPLRSVKSPFEVGRPASYTTDIVSRFTQSALSKESFPNHTQANWASTS